MNSGRGLPIIIAGGGIGGLSAAIGLRSLGLDVVLVERARQFGEIGAGIQLAPNAFRALEALGVKDGAFKKSVYVERLVMMDAMDGKEVARITLDEGYRRWFKNPYAVIHRAELHETLLQSCRESGVKLLPDTELSDFTQTSGEIEIQTVRGERIQGAALIGADGLRSRVRAKIVGDGSPLIAGHVCFRGTLPVEQMPTELRWNAMAVWVGPKIHFVHYPLSGSKLFNIVATFHDSAATVEQIDAQGEREELLSHFQILPPLPRSVLEKSTGWRRWVLGDREPVANWTQGRVTLLGDAAHPTYQYFAQGACMAIEDAVCLMEEVKRAEGDLATAFLAYQEKRITRTARIVLSARAIGRYFFHVEGVERLVRNHIIGSKTQQDFHRSLDWVWGYGRD
jgi:2-polyprenyl-6-methoxyphenol hydroxylase-like FAD-dependent oxidoreductase